MCSHWRKYAPQLYELLCKYITIFDEYPVENTHSILRAQTKSSDTADQLRKKAKSIFQSKDKQSNFRSFFTAPKQFSFSHNQLQFLKVRCAQLLSSMLKKISQSPGQSSFSSRNRSSKSAPSHVTLLTMCSNNPMKTSVLPLGYHGEFKPDQTRKCDLPECQISSKDEDWTLLDGCFHSFHIGIPATKVKDLSEIAQQAILNPASDRPDSNNDNSETTTSSPSTDDMGNEHVEHHHTVPNAIILSEDISDLTAIHTLPVISAPTVSVFQVLLSVHVCGTEQNRSQSRSRQQTPQPATETQRIPVTVNQHLDVTEWLLPSYICQSTIGGGQTGSNACTVIALLTGLNFLQSTLSIPNQLQDLNQTIPVYCQLIFKGNHIYSSFNLHPNQPNLDVKEVLQKKEASYQNIEMVAYMGFFSSQDLEDYIVQYIATIKHSLQY
ncbi:hypothetical protein OS493_031051 [Desmophyllum pertusum]|uniref:Uncharacterized protein n=1 Tax=Desmophyllum pertusum TaxID=174260 RepID=A0A9W9YW98_9CNID|nr:hypothetical protein OS493_031051 [Desmophyllum pertusum]